MPPKRKRDNQESTGGEYIGRAPTRRSTNACHRCRSKKLKCNISVASLPRSAFPQRATEFVCPVDDISLIPETSTCDACVKSGSECIFDVAPDVVSRGPEYVNALESRLATLEDQLRRVQRGSSGLDHPPQVVTPRVEQSERGTSPDNASTTYESNGPMAEFRDDGSMTVISPDFSRMQVVTPFTNNGLRKPGDDRRRGQHKLIELATDGITICNFLFTPHISPELNANALPMLPSQHHGNMLFETTYLYTQARYCLADWVQVRKWHQRREDICYSANTNDVEASTGGFFIWIVYAIGAQLASNSPSSSSGYYARALRHLPVVLSQQNLTALQALLLLVQYYYRSPGGPSLWHLVGYATRLCIELGLHRKTPIVGNLGTVDPYQSELRKRLFWSAYCFDRSISNLSKRPFAIQDRDIDVELPVDIDVTCVNAQSIQDQRSMQPEGGPNTRDGEVTTMTSSLYHLDMYRLQSRIQTRFSSLNAEPSSSDEILGFLNELESWKSKVDEMRYPQNFPRQGPGHVRAIYYLTSVFLLRPTLYQQPINEEFLHRLANLAVDACENEKAICFSPQTHSAPIKIYNCFRFGLILLQCLAICRTIVPAHRALRGINACSSALGVYTGALSVARSYLQLYDRLSSHFLSFDMVSTEGSNDNIRSLLQKVTSCDPSEIPELLRSISAEDAQEGSTSQMGESNTFSGLDSMNEMFSVTTSGMDLVLPFELLEDNLVPDVFQEDMIGFWGGVYGS